MAISGRFLFPLHDAPNPRHLASHNPILSPLPSPPLHHTPLSADEAWQELVAGLDDAKEHAAFLVQQLEALKAGDEPILAPHHIHRTNQWTAGARLEPGSRPELAKRSADIYKGGLDYNGEDRTGQMR